MYSTIPRNKIGDCSQCDAKNTDCVKRGKELFCLSCARNNKAKQQLTKSIERQKVRSLVRTDTNLETKGSMELNRWFEERRKEMTNCCVECGRTTNKLNNKYYKWSICHIVPKSLVKSVATNQYNFIELCQLHHQEFDSTFDRAANMMCFGEVKLKFQLFKKLIPDYELRKVNPHLLN